MYEIERKFFVNNDDWKSCSGNPVNITQGYIDCINNIVRIRIEDSKAEMTIKSPITDRKSLEFNFPIPIDEAILVVQYVCEFVLIKQRFRFMSHNKLWEVDVFSGKLFGLVTAEIELSDEDEEFERPSWLGREVTGDKKFSNFSLAKNGEYDV